MKNTNIAKIHTKLINIITITNTEPFVTSDMAIGDIAHEILALLPCETCGGLKKKLEYAKVCPECGCPDYVNENLVGEGYRQCRHCLQDWWKNVKYAIGKEPCPDCQQPEIG